MTTNDHDPVSIESASTTVRLHTLPVCSGTVGILVSFRSQQHLLLFERFLKRLTRDDLQRLFLSHEDVDVALASVGDIRTPIKHLLKGYDAAIQELSEQDQRPPSLGEYASLLLIEQIERSATLRERNWPGERRQDRILKES